MSTSPSRCRNSAHEMVVSSRVTHSSYQIWRPVLPTAATASATRATGSAMRAPGAPGCGTLGPGAGGRVVPGRSPEARERGVSTRAYWSSAVRGSIPGDQVNW